MPGKKHLFNTSTWIALFAITLSLLAQTTPLWAKSSNGQAIEICSAFGSRIITIDENGKEIPAAPQSKYQNHCPLCFVSTAHAITPPLQIIALARTQTHKIAYPNFDEQTPSKSAHISHNIRAPPVHS
ncbi:MAG: DUF2946 family protein [Alphaproteobacteria bacterium]